MKKIQNIQSLRAIAVMLVVMLHVTNAEQKYMPSNVLLPQTLSALYASGVDIFFIISGFIMVMVSKEREALRFLYKRFSRIYPLYWFYSLIVLALYLYRPDMVNSSQGNQVNIPFSRRTKIKATWYLKRIGISIFLQRFSPCLKMSSLLE